jgi:hypothetical protein
MVGVESRVMKIAQSIAQSMVVCASLAFALACGGGGGMGTNGLTVSLANSSAQVFQGQASTTVDVSLTRTGSTGNVTLTVTGLPSGASDTVQSPGTANSGIVTLSASTGAAPGTYTVTITASDGTVSGNESLSLTVGAAAVISANQTGPFMVAMSTSFQPAEWDYQFFQTNPGATTTLGNLGPHHVRLQGISQGVPQTTATTWNFGVLDAITQPVLAVADHSPEFQIAVAPAFMYDANHNFLDPTYAQFAAYTQNLVQYYDLGGFTSGDGVFHVSKAYPSDIITWWGIYNEPNFNNLDSTQYTALYNAVVPAIQAVDPSLKYAAVELGDYSGLANQYLPAFVSGVKAHVDVLATHFYSTCNQKDSDSTLFTTVPGFATEVGDIYTLMKTSGNPVLANVPVWVTENNVNADYDKGNNISACNGTTFVDDLRGSSPFFAAWRPYVFAQLGKAGVQALYHWDFEADPQFGEVADAKAALQLSYWVDYELGQLLPPTAASQLLEYSATDDGELETLPIVNADGSVVVMVANHTVNVPATDNNGPGAPRSVLVDVSALGTFTSGSLLVIDKDTNVASGPVATTVTPAAQIPLNLNGYSVAFLTLKP